MYRSDLDSVRIVDSLARVDRDAWNALAGAQPFMRHEFLAALIETGCAAARSGWLPQARPRSRSKVTMPWSTPICFASSR